MEMPGRILLGVGTIFIIYGVTQAISQMLTPTPPPGKATLIVDTTPVKGGVYINGSLIEGIPPLTFELSPGDYTVGFGDVEGWITPDTTTITLNEGDNVTLTGTYKPVVTTKATLIITTTGVVNTVVTLTHYHGYMQGVTPLTWPIDLEIFGTEFVMSFADHEGYITPDPIGLSLKAGDVVTIARAYEPVPNTATLIITTTPFNVVITLIHATGYMQGATPATLTLDLSIWGTDFVLSFPDYVGYTTPDPVELTLAEGDVVTVARAYEPI